jgi:hypothetical protein
MIGRNGTMKKTYSKPVAEVIDIQISSMLCLSAGMSGSQNSSDALGREDEHYDW